jgi:hypothetical protein
MTSEQDNQNKRGGCLSRVLGGGTGALLGGVLGAVGGVMLAWPLFGQFYEAQFGGSSGFGVSPLLIAGLVVLFLGGGALLGGLAGVVAGGMAGSFVGKAAGEALGRLTQRFPWVGTTLRVLVALLLLGLVGFCVVALLTSPRPDDPPSAPPSAPPASLYEH